MARTTACDHRAWAIGADRICGGIDLWGPGGLGSSRGAISENVARGGILRVADQPDTIGKGYAV
jgi:hypothetical protein